MSSITTSGSGSGSGSGVGSGWVSGVVVDVSVDVTPDDDTDVVGIRAPTVPRVDTRADVSVGAARETTAASAPGASNATTAAHITPQCANLI